MKIILKQDVEGLGKIGDVEDVAPGYARNYLIPQGMAIVATPSALKKFRAEQQARIEREAREAEKATQLAERIGHLTLRFEAKAGPTGRLYGSVTTSDIAEALEKELGTEVDRRNIESDPLRDIGAHTVPLRLSSDVTAEVRVVVEPEGGELPEAEESAE